MKTVFFYGLFMDQSLLKEKGFSPSTPILTRVEGYGLRIGERATLIKSEGECAYGMTMSLSEDELGKLYGENSVADYRPETLLVTDANNDRLAVSCYNLPADKLTGSNKKYAESLVGVAKKVKLPAEYIAQIKKWAN